LEESEIFGVSTYSLKRTMSKEGIQLLQVGLEQVATMAENAPQFCSSPFTEPGGCCMA
jgi:hypothetical protein